VRGAARENLQQKTAVQAAHEIWWDRQSCSRESTDSPTDSGIGPSITSPSCTIASQPTPTLTVNP
jgi:hypothetical protein